MIHICTRHMVRETERLQVSRLKDAVGRLQHDLVVAPFLLCYQNLPVLHWHQPPKQVPRLLQPFRQWLSGASCVQLGSEARNSHLLHVRLRFAGGTVQSPVYPRGQSHLPVACGCQPRSLSAEAQPLISICLPQCLPAQLLVAGATAPSTALLP